MLRKTPPRSRNNEAIPQLPGTTVIVRCGALNIQYYKKRGNMARVVILLVYVVVLQGCSSLKQSNDAAIKDYYTASISCVSQAENQVSTQVPTGKAMTTVEIPVGFNAGIFGDCMIHAGHPPPQADPEPYLATARKCMDEALGASNPEQVYANCVGRILDVEVITGNQQR